MPLSANKKVERIQTGIRLEKRLVKVLKALAEHQDIAAAGLRRRVDSLLPPIDPARNLGGASDDIGDVSWTVPTAVIYYPANLEGLPGHHWANAMTMATPIAHKGSVAGAKAAAMTLLDLLLRPGLVDSARGYFRDVQTRETQYRPLIRAEDQPPLELNREVAARFFRAGAGAAHPSLLGGG